MAPAVPLHTQRYHSYPARALIVTTLLATTLLGLCVEAAVERRVHLRVGVLSPVPANHSSLQAVVTYLAAIEQPYTVVNVLEDVAADGTLPLVRLVGASFAT